MIEEKPRAKATPKKKAATNGHSGKGKRAKGTLYAPEALAQIARWIEIAKVLGAVDRFDRHAADGGEGTIAGGRGRDGGWLHATTSLAPSKG